MLMDKHMHAVYKLQKKQFPGVQGRTTAMPRICISVCVICIT